MPLQVLTVPNLVDFSEDLLVLGPRQRHTREGYGDDDGHANVYTKLNTYKQVMDASLRVAVDSSGKNSSEFSGVPQIPF